MVDLYEQWIEKAEGHKAFFYRDAEGRLRYAGGPGGGGGSAGGGTAAGSTTIAPSRFTDIANWYGDKYDLSPAEAEQRSVADITEGFLDKEDALYTASSMEQTGNPLFSTAGLEIDLPTLQYAITKRWG